MATKALTKAKEIKDDEFYTQYSDIEKELKHYEQQFVGATIYCNCDTPDSNFCKYFIDNFETLKLKQLIATGYNPNGNGAYLKVENSGNGFEIEQHNLIGDGDYLSLECLSYLGEADIVVTNPPFSKFREFLDKVMQYEKKFLLLGSQTAIGYKEIFPHFQQKEMWLGCTNGDMWFKVPDNTAPRKVRYREDSQGKWRSLGNVCWFTNLDHNKRHELLELRVSYKAREFNRYHNLEGINVDKVEDIPYDFDGVIGVPITYMFKHNSDQFDIVGYRKGDDGNDLWYRDATTGQIVTPYTRILIQRRTTNRYDK